MAGLVPFNRRNSDLLRTGFDDFQNMLDDFFSNDFSFRRSLAGDTFKLDVQDNEKEYVVEAELPGIDKDDITLSLEEGRLQIAIKKEERVEENNKNYIHRERRYSSMCRNIFLADSDPGNIKAKLDNGLLTITVSKKPKTDNSIKIDID